MTFTRKSILTLASPILLSSFIAFGQDSTTGNASLIENGKTKFEQICIACHKYERTDTMIAPPAFGIQMRYKNAFGSDETAFRQAIVNWAKAPEARKSHMPGAIQKFKLMPPLPLPDEDLDAIAAYLYSAAFTEACNMQGGMGNGPGNGAGKGNGPRTGNGPRNSNN